MQAAFIDEPGDASRITVGDLPTPEPGPGQVRVRVRAASVNPIDVYIRSGAVTMELPRPFIIGSDLAGVVDAVGPDVDAWRPGDRVWASNQGMKGRQGTFAEFAVLDQDWLHRSPEGVRDEDLAASALVGITSQLGLRASGLKGSETLYVTGGSGGIGSTVVQMAKALGARVITSAGSDANLATCRALGADHAFNYKSDDLATQISEVAPGGVNVWWEATREPDLELATKCLALAGRIVVIAGRGATGKLPIGPFYNKDGRIIGLSMMNAGPRDQQPCGAEVARLLAEGMLKPNIGLVLPLADAAKAHQLQEDNTIHKAGTLAGKIVVVMDGR